MGSSVLGHTQGVKLRNCYNRSTCRLWPQRQYYLTDRAVLLRDASWSRTPCRTPRWQRVLEPGADLHPQRAQLQRRRGIAPQELPGGPHRAQGQARGRDEPAATHPAELQARPAEVRDDALGEREALEGRHHPEERLV